MSRICNCPFDGGPSMGPSLATACGGSQFLLFMGVLEAFLRTQCDINDPCRKAKSTEHPFPVYDFVVVGAGSGGSVVASRLSENPLFNVLLIEAGDNEPLGVQVPPLYMNYQNTDIDWKFKTEPESSACLSSPEHRCSWPRGKALGGTSVINGMSYNRGNAADYDEWAAQGNAGWQYDEVLPYFKMSEKNENIDEVDRRFHGVDGPLSIGYMPFNPVMTFAILKGGQELGYDVVDLNGANATGFSLQQYFNEDGVRVSTAKAFIRPAVDRLNLDIWLRTTVTKVILEDNRAIGVQAIDRNGHSFEIGVRKEVIVCAGVINSPQLLMLSGIGNVEELSEVGIIPLVNLPGVGKNLHNHVGFSLTYFTNQNDINLQNWASAMEYIQFRQGPLAGLGINGATAKVCSSFASSPDNPDLQLYFAGYLATCSNTGILGEANSNGTRTATFIPCVLHPKSRGSIELFSNDPLAHPRIYANYLSDSRDLQVLIEGIRFAQRLASTSALKSFGLKLSTVIVKGCEDNAFNSDEYWDCAIRQNTGQMHHQAGTCKMGPATDPWSVVDNQLRVRSIVGLRVVDASVMPQVTSGNPNAAIIMIAEKAVEYIRQTWMRI